MFEFICAIVPPRAIVIDVCADKLAGGQSESVIAHTPRECFHVINRRFPFLADGVAIQKDADSQIECFVKPEVPISVERDALR